MAYTRNRTLVFPIGISGVHYIPFLGNQTETQSFPMYKTCTDVVGNRKGDNPFLAETTWSTPIWIDGTSGGHTYKKVPLQNCNVVPAHLITHGMNATVLNQAGVKVVAKTNPNAPSVGVPTFVGELKELPSLIKSFGLKHLKRISQYTTGYSFAKEAANRHLQWRWGIKPMISDLKKMVDFASAVNKRMRWLERLSTGSPLHRRCAIDESTSSSVSSGYVYSHGCLINCRFVTTTQQRSWGSAQWKIDDPIRFPFTHDDRLREARRLVSGMNPQAMTLTAWELMPWSWFIDWFTGFGDLIGAIQNHVSVKHSRICVMRRTETDKVGYIISQTGSVKITGSIGSGRITKQRYVVTNPNPVTISVLPLLEGDKWSILGSLGIQMRRG